MLFCFPLSMFIVLTDFVRLHLILNFGIKSILLPRSQKPTGDTSASTLTVGTIRTEGSPPHKPEFFQGWTFRQERGAWSRMG